ncbi:MAG: FkbM family methyltransferase [Acidobacteriia bacterium]|nr:FkbM family methyltransferase [Terriglobia bacterium]
MHLQATASRAATLLARNPALFCRLMLAKLSTARRMPPLPARRRIHNVLFEYDLNHYRGTAPMYFGSYALLVVEAMKRFLNPGDVFFDVGANIGYLSAIGADLVGTRGQVHCFEPVPAYFERLRRLAELNPDYSIAANPVAAGETPGTCTIYVTREPGQSTLVRSYKTGPEIVSTLEVPVVRLDSYIAARNIGRVALIKIDAEGFELPVLKGLQSYFDISSHKPAIICEVAPRAYRLMGRNIKELAAFMAKYGYTARDLIDGVTPVDLCSIDHVEDVLFLASA